MPITIELQDMFSYSLLLVVGAVALVVLIGIIGLIVFLKTKNKKQSAPSKPTPEPKPVAKPVSGEQIKQKYCTAIDDLENKCRGGKMNNRKAYQNLSVILRRFVYELTGVKVHNYTLDEINRLNMPSLSEVIGECYAPEFSVDKDGNIYDTMNKARMVIKEWR